MLPARFETERLLLRAQDPSDAALMHRLWTERDPRVPAHRRIVDGRPSASELAAQLTAADPHRAGLRTVILRATDTAIGYCGLLTGSGRGDAASPELAYELLSAHHGLGYATEAAAAVIAWADTAGIARVQAGVRDWNLPSLRVLDKLGFRASGIVEPDAVHGDSILLERDRPADARR